jgi:hypothetical protein
MGPRGELKPFGSEPPPLRRNTAKAGAFHCLWEEFI